MRTIKNYKVYKNEEVTKEILDTIQKGDLIKVNDWGKPFRVRGVTDNYFIMTCNMFGNIHYSVCEKKRWNGIRYNQMRGGKFHIGTDYWIFASPTWNNYDGKVDYDNAEAVIEYLESFDLEDNNSKPRSELSVRTSIPIDKIYVKHKEGY